MNIVERQRGVYVVLMAVLLVVLIAFGALSLDLGRLFILRSEMQNAADAAALAAALELSGRSGSRANAVIAARDVLEHDSNFASVRDLLGSHIGVEFHCAIGSEYDPEDISSFCSNAYVDGRSPAANDAEAHYVRVLLEPEVDSDAYSIELYFLPVLNALSSGVENRAFLNAAATAGRNYYMCNWPPVMLCNPFESVGGQFNTAMSRGGQIQLKQQGGNTWSSGNVSFLQPDVEPGGGAPEVAEYLADEGLVGCTPPIISTETGGMTNQTASALNTRFDLYNPPSPFNRPNAPSLFPPAPNVINYPRDLTWDAVPGDARFGNGDWNRTQYWSDYHAWKGLYLTPSGYDSMNRYEVYLWEISESKIPARAPATPGFNAGLPAFDGNPDPSHVYTGDYPPPRTIPDRRVIHVAVANCIAHDLTGKKTFPLIAPEGFARLFITEQVASPPNADIYVEYIDWSDESDENFHVDIQLYE